MQKYAKTHRVYEPHVNVSPRAVRMNHGEGEASKQITQEEVGLTQSHHRQPLPHS